MVSASRRLSFVWERISLLMYGSARPLIITCFCSRSAAEAVPSAHLLHGMHRLQVLACIRILAPYDLTDSPCSWVMPNRELMETVPLVLLTARDLIAAMTMASSLSAIDPLACATSSVLSWSEQHWAETSSGRIRASLL